MKGIVLAGGSGTRLYPLTAAINKQLLPVFDKPMVYYPLSVLMLAQIRHVLIISSPGFIDSYRTLFGDGSSLGMRFEYAVQDAPRGLADAFHVGWDFIGNDPVGLVLGDNILYGQGLSAMLYQAASRPSGARIFTYRVPNPKDFGVIELDAEGRPTAIIEKPSEPRSNLAVPGIYFYDNRVLEIAASIQPSARGELEITDINRAYLAMGDLHVTQLGRGIAWLDTGTFDALLDASNFIATLERRQGLKAGCIEEVAYRNGWISEAQLLALADASRNSEYGRYLRLLPAIV